MVAAKSRTTTASFFTKLNGQEQCFTKVVPVSLKSLFVSIPLLFNTRWDIKILWKHLWKIWETNAGFWLHMMKKINKPDKKSS